MTNSKIFFYCCLSFIGGIFLDSFFSLPQISFSLWWLGLIAFSFYFSWKQKAPFFLFLIMLSAGVYRHQLFSQKVEANSLFPLIKTKSEIVLIGVVDDYPDRREKNTKLTVKLPGHSEKILVNTWKYPQFDYGDKLKIQGRLEKPETFDGFDYPSYLAKEGILGVMYYPQVERIGKGFGSPFSASLFSFRDKLKEVISRLLPVPQAGLLEALIFGDEEKIPEHWKEKFNITGTRHIAAVSGMNITIISFLILNFLVGVGIGRKQSFYLSVITIVMFVLTIGAPASGVRAAIMGILFLAAQHFGRMSNGVRAIVFAAGLMLFFNPLLLKDDVGFQLSFLAILGLVFWQPVFSSWMEKIPNFFQLRDSLSSTLAAQLFTFPILLYHFGQVSLLGPLANLFIIPLLPFATIFGFLVALVGMVFPFLAQLGVFAVWLPLTYIFKIVGFFYQLPTNVLSWQGLGFGGLMFLYLVLGLVTWRMEEKKKLSFLFPKKQKRRRAL